MKKILLVAVVLFLAATLSFTADFAPNLMTIDSDDWIVYDFAGGDLQIPVTLGGKPAAIFLVITTQGKGAEIGEVSNGHLDWHYVNKIDTTIYLSPKVPLQIGVTDLTWDGKDNDGGTVEAGTYTYYLWGFDDTSNREMATEYVMICHDWLPMRSKLTCFEGDKMPMANPVFFGNPPWFDQRSVGGHTHKWTLGHDPEDRNGRISTVCNIYKTQDFVSEPGFLSQGAPVLDPDDHDIFYGACRNNDEAMFTMLKWTFVADGDAILDNDWGGWESDLVFENPSMAASPNEWAVGSGVCSDTQNLYMNGQGGGDLQWNYIYIVDFNGELIEAVNHEEMYFPEENNVNSTPFLLDWLQTRNNTWAVWGSSCLMEVIDYTGTLEGDDYEVVWQNKNGDFFFDRSYEADAGSPWSCTSGGSQGRHSSLTPDSKGFGIWGTGQLGVANFGLTTPDGTGVGYFNFADETVGDETVRKGAGTICDNGSAFDGMYWHRAINNPVIEENMWAWGTGEWIGFDNFEGTISDKEVSVEADDAQAEFSIAQNVPNPFNPTTTINFTISEDDFVTLDIYNVAGQKVDTLVNDFRSAGTYSAVWDASGLSAGVYFYTLKADDSSKTMKMTLLK